MMINRLISSFGQKAVVGGPQSASLARIDVPTFSEAIAKPTARGPDAFQSLSNSALKVSIELHETIVRAPFDGYTPAGRIAGSVTSPWCDEPNDRLRRGWSA
eukprot:scaffold375107_cov23-Prasinocladus_malaysianus.AAC.1